MRSLIALFLLSLSGLGLIASPANASHVRYVYSVETEWSPHGTYQAVTVETHWQIGDEVAPPASARPASGRFVPRTATFNDGGPRTGQAVGTQYGPFRVVGASRVIMSGSTDAATPAQFAAMLRDHPGLQTLEMHDCPGTSNDQANLKLGRMIRAAGLSTHVPAGGSVRSGAVELFLAGASRQVDEGAEFAVHSWMDIYGRQAKDFALSAPQNRAYLDYYREMGMDESTARDFYAMTNSVPFSQALWLKAGEMREWLTPAHAQAAAPGLLSAAAPVAPAAPAAENAEPQLAYLDFAGASF